MGEKFIITDDIKSGEEMQRRDYYNSLASSKNNFSYWFAKVKDCGMHIPESVIIPVPIDVLSSMFLENDGDDRRIRKFIYEDVLPKIPENWEFVFMKNGCFSDKYDFRICSPEKTLDSMYENFVKLSQDSLCYDTGGNTELILREYIDAPDDNPTMYHGLPIRPEVRAFYDFDVHKVLYSVNYWDWDYCHEEISVNVNDKWAYEKAYPELKKFLKKNQRTAVKELSDALQNVTGLEGIWSVDIMFADGKWWLIDMALGHQSAYFDYNRIKKIKRIHDDE